MTDNTQEQISRTKILFLAWGYSIHAQRRIQLFVDDPSFDVAVASTHNYNFPGARNYLLTDARPGNSICRLLFRGLRFITFNSTPSLIMEDLYKGVKDIKTVKAAVREFRPDIVFLQTLLYPCYLSYFLPKSLPIVITFWNGDVVWWAKWNGIERLCKKWIVTYGVRRARAITVNSQSALNACLGYGGNAEKIHLIRYPGVDLDRFKPLSRDAAREKLGIRAGRVVLSPRGLGGYLNSDVIVESAAGIIKRHPDTLFIFISGVGMSSELEKHQARARSLGIDRNFKWEGQVAWELMPLYYNAADVVVSVSSNDSLPNCMLEAMSCGVPLVMADIPQIREWVTDDINGYLVSPRDADALSNRIIQLLDNDGGIVQRITEVNLRLVNATVDSKKNIAAIKQLVRIMYSSL